MFRFTILILRVSLAGSSFAVLLPLRLDRVPVRMTWFNGEADTDKLEKGVGVEVTATDNVIPVKPLYSNRHGGCQHIPWSLVLEPDLVHR